MGISVDSMNGTATERRGYKERGLDGKRDARPTSRMGR
jgi:hypothetical protein